ncbi:TetR/AcrR family transcriptional regulator [Rhodopseudomonas sp. P2A-2r]|uniref:TetR/AcrR family transcriptional regulator n=1 Tax=unclassified Rhodopseudomonas TaxID=2638247 RepID=UPI002234D9F8|nr:TetR/AcrR family transcriptional regulator [Rhodopseudomonas sp. P2A-2r]UZE51989.1 TetR/AcrR family transcriptional regulator [Rhodopseudomonas sp. P2A-2r]
MQAATRLFCKHGINATGIDAIVHEAGTAKTTLYKLFGSKSDLVEAVLLSESRIWRDWFVAAVEVGGSPRAKLDSIFPVLKSWFSEEDYYGCVFINAVGEHDKDETRLRAITLQHKSFVLDYIAGLARGAGAGDPGALAHQLGILMDGAIVAAMVTRDPGIADSAGIAANALLNEACGRAPRRSARRSATKALATQDNFTVR